MSCRLHRRPLLGGEANEAGFALLVTITLAAFLVLLLLSLTTLTRIETRVATNSQAQAAAKQNALMALNVAIGQLQLQIGPDQRVSAPADIILPPSMTPTAATTGADALAEVDAYWRDLRNRRWTGVWQNTNDTSYNPNDALAYNPVPSPEPAWLVSGNEDSAGNFKPTDQVSGLTLASVTAAENIITDQATGRSYRLLVGANTVNIASAAQLDRAVVAPEVEIKSAASPGRGGASATIGHYAWWAGDEGVKARANLVDPYASGTSTSDQRHRLASSQRLAIEAMTTDGADGLATFRPTNDEDLLKLYAPLQLRYLAVGETALADVANHFHDLGISSRGVLADTKHGGLKRDLSYILSRPDLVSFRTALETVSSGAATYDVAPQSTWNPMISVTSTPYAAFPDDEPTGPGYHEVPTVLDYSATWEQLWSHYNMGNLLGGTPAGVFDAGGVAHCRPPSATQSGLFPVLVQAKLFYNLTVTGGVITVQIMPMAVLANPYNVPISGDFILRFTKPNPVLVVGSITDASKDLVYSDSNTNAGKTPGSAGYTDNLFYKLNGDLGNGYLGNIPLVIHATAINPGEAQIFTVDPDDDTVIANAADSHPIGMINTYDPSAFITYSTGKSIPSGCTEAALYTYLLGGPELYMNDTQLENRLVTISTRRPDIYTPGAIDANDKFGFVVYPIADGTQVGGGFFFAMQDGNTPLPQQSTFYQVNYRPLKVGPAGNYSYGDHPLEWAVAYGVLGQDNAGNTTPNSFFSANILPPPGAGIPSTTRWGLINSGAFPSLNTTPATISDPDTGFVNLLYDMPSPSFRVNSLGQLQHFNLAGHHTGATSDTAASRSILANSYQVNYPIANSYPTPRVKRDRVYYSSDSYSAHYDGSYLLNDVLWDRFYFSSYPGSGNFDFSTDSLVNARYKPFRSQGSVAWDDPVQFRGVYQAAKNLLVDGAFNINSTSVDAWKAVFSSLKNVPIGSETPGSSGNARLNAPFARTTAPVGSSINAMDGVSANAWNGFRNLTQDEINMLAEEMVLQVRLRGPFLSMSEFVNRRLIKGRAVSGISQDPLGLGLGGALQAAIDKVVNQRADIPSPYNSLTPWRSSSGATGADNGLLLGDRDYVMSSRIAGFPGYLLQGDVLSPLGPFLSARSDTFTIRTYGDVVNPSTSEVEGQAWCEAIVQRMPDYVVSEAAGGDAPEDIPTANSVNATFGRRYQVVGFRWLNASDI